MMSLAVFRAAAMAWSMFWYLYVPSLPANVTLGFCIARYLLYSWVGSFMG